MYDESDGNEMEQNASQEEVQRAPTPINQLPNYHDKENNAQRLEAIKDYLKHDNQFESVPEEIEAENREESDIEGSVKSSPYREKQQSNPCQDESQEEDEDEHLQFNCNDNE